MTRLTGGAILVWLSTACGGHVTGYEAPPPPDAGPDGCTHDGMAALDPDAGVEPSPWVELVEPGLDVEGGAAIGGLGRDGGRVVLRSSGAMVIDPLAALEPPPALPAIPLVGAHVSGSALAADVSIPGTILLVGPLETSGAGDVRVITATSGDLVVGGKLETAGQSLVLRAPAGTVFVTGVVDSRAAEAGDAAGSVVIEARRVVVTGSLITAGADDGGRAGPITLRATAGPVLLSGGALVASGGASTTLGGDGGAILISATEPSFLAGVIDACGGDARGVGEVIGGHGGAITVTAPSEVQLTGALRLRGGAAVSLIGRAVGGDAGLASFDTAGRLRIGAIVDGRGGLSSSNGADVPGAGGAAGAVEIGAAIVPSTLVLAGAVLAIGGAGDTGGGGGGSVTLTIDAADLVQAGLIAVDGGASRGQGGPAGIIEVTVGTTSGGIHVSGVLRGVGGATTNGVLDGGDGATIALVATSRSGPMVIGPTGVIVADGGGSAGGDGGAGGDLLLETRDGDASIGGHLLARGGNGGGRGGKLELFTDANFNGVGGDLAIETSGWIDVSGGGGGGAARNNGTGGVAYFPDEDDEIAVLLNSDGKHGSPRDGTLVNRGHIVATGGAPNGWGGDIMFHGRQPGNNEDPLPGELTLDGSGTGHDGDFVPE